METNVLILTLCPLPLGHLMAWCPVSPHLKQVGGRGQALAMWPSSPHLSHLVLESSASPCDLCTVVPCILSYTIPSSARNSVWLCFSSVTSMMYQGNTIPEHEMCQQSLNHRVTKAVRCGCLVVTPAPLVCP